MSRKDYRLFAEEIRCEPDAELRRCMAEIASRVFARDNARFDCERFYSACEPRRK